MQAGSDVLAGESAPLSRAAALGGLGFLALFAALAVYVSYQRGPWYDEFWSVFHAQRDVGLATAWNERWMLDVSPPYFYLIAWLAQPLTGDLVFVKRLLNLVPLAIAALGFVLLYRRAETRRAFLPLFAVLLMAHPFAIGFFAEHRPYFWMYGGAALLAASLWLIVGRGRDYRPDDRWLLALALAGILLSFSFHYVVAAEIGLVLAAFVVGLWSIGMRGWAVRLSAAAVVGSIPLLIAFALQYSTLFTFRDVGWIARMSPLVAYLMLGWVVLLSMLVSAAAFAIHFALGRKGVEGVGDDSAGQRAFVRMTLIGLAFSFAAMLLLNHVKPVLILRYLIPYVPFILAPVAVLATRPFATRPLGLASVLVFGLFVMGYGAKGAAGEERWNEGGKAIASIKERCPQATIYPLLPWEAGAKTGPHVEEEVAVFGMGVEAVASRFDFEVAREFALGADCPTILWVPHYLGKVPAPKTVLANARLPVPPAVAKGARTMPVGNGFLILIPEAVDNGDD